MRTTRRRIIWSSAALLTAAAATLTADRGTVAPPQAPGLAAQQTCWSEDFDGVVAPALPPGWTTLTISGAFNSWVTSVGKSDTAPNEAATGNPGTVSDNALTTGMITFPPGAATLTFRQSFDTEFGNDGGVLEIGYYSSDGFSVGPFTDIVNAGGAFVSGGYTSTLSGGFGNPLSGRQAWTGNSGGFITTTVNLPAGASGKSGKLRWRIGTDSSIAGSGWSIDSMTLGADPCGTGALPGAFSRVAPEDIGLHQSELQPVNLTLVWSPSAGAVSYEYCLITGALSQCDGNTNWINTGANTSVAVTNLAPASQYRWHVRALNGAGATYANNNPPGFGSSYWRFNTQPLPPGAFSKTTPLSGATNRPTTLTLNWTPSAGATGYEYCIDKTDNGACGSVWASAGNATSVTIKDLDPSTVHSWHVRANNVAGTTYADAGPTAFTAFTTASLSRVPVIDFDGNGSGDVLVQETQTGQWSWQLYQQTGGFLGSAGGNQGVNVTTTTMVHTDDARTDAFRFNSVTGEFGAFFNDGSSFGFYGNGGAWWPDWQRHVLDLNGDRKSDMFLYDPATGVWFQCSWGPGFLIPQQIVTSCRQGGWNPGWEIYPMRLNNDAFGDFFLINRTTGRWFWALGTGADSWSFTYPVTETWFTGWNIHPGDFNGDGLSDLLLHDPGTGVYFVAMNTGAGFTYTSNGWAVAWKPIVADLNGDGKDDVFRHDPATGNWSPMISDGAGGFTKVGTGTWSLGWQIHPTDFDGDGRADFLLYHPGTGVWYQARTTGPGTFAYTTGTWKPGLTISTGAIGR
jgi:hypothetical protein